MSYFKVSNQTAVQAFKDFNAAKAALIEQATVLANHFGGEPIFSNRFEQISFAGINFHNFNQLENNHLWLKPKATNCFASEPKYGKPKAADREALEAIKATYNAMRPEPVSREPLLASIGVSWGDCLFSRLHMFLHNDVIYLDTWLKPIDAIEILGSEYQAAKNEYTAGKKASNQPAQASAA
ncbi:hypothetical protein FJD32_009275 [Shewanella sp. LC6]|uniref:hypothetical protein n=1 Tax=unclassified Shewanella TaxID=196818 RepID=UPI001128C62E|nr:MULTISPECIES: hypothetical protein [unclassified Shewanella]QQK59677.1 hypothetical protein FJD32_009275 [Shewanella sp. LC6]TPE56644.1 hypothetical protein FJD33_13865 [Shewanella sp. LC2]